MGADIKALRVRIKSVDSTLHLTKAMGLVASSKIRRAQEAMNAGRAYADAAARVMHMLSGCRECSDSPYLKTHGERTALVVIAGDRGLAGGYNSNIFRLVKALEYDRIFPVGKRACDRYGGGTLTAEKFTYSQAQSLAQDLCDGILSGAFDKVGIVSTKYVSALSQTAQVQWILPFAQSGEYARKGIIFEPNEQAVLLSAVPVYIAGALWGAVCESYACEVASRRTAMDAASKNAQQMIDGLQLEYNRARQGSITQEITEIVSGSGI